MITTTLEGRTVTAKRLGWDEQLSAEEAFDLDPQDHGSDELEGTLAVLPARSVDGWECPPVYLVGGQEADPTTVEETDEPADNAFCPTGKDGKVDPSCSPEGTGKLAGTDKSKDRGSPDEKGGDSTAVAAHTKQVLQGLGRIVSKLPPVDHAMVKKGASVIAKTLKRLYERYGNKGSALTFLAGYTAFVTVGAATGGASILGAAAFGLAAIESRKAVSHIAGLMEHDDVNKLGETARGGVTAPVSAGKRAPKKRYDSLGFHYPDNQTTHNAEESKNKMDPDVEPNLDTLTKEALSFIQEFAEATGIEPPNISPDQMKGILVKIQGHTAEEPGATQNGELVTHGGPGSGNFGHAGRPGKRGGSASRSSSSAMMDKPGDDYEHLGALELDGLDDDNDLSIDLPPLDRGHDTPVPGSQSPTGWFYANTTHGTERLSRKVTGVGSDPKAKVMTEIDDDADSVQITVDHPDYFLDRELAVDSKGALYVHNNLFLVPEGKEGKGVGADIFAQQVRELQGTGISYLKCEAAGYGKTVRPDDKYNGFYTWPRFGYDMSLTDPSVTKSMRGSALQSKTKEVYEQARKLFPEARTVLDVFSTKEGRDWWKLNGAPLPNARFDLTPGSRSMKILEAYQFERGSRSSATTNSGVQMYEDIVLTTEQEAALDRAWDNLDLTENVFCPTGVGGGRDPSCSPGGVRRGKVTGASFEEDSEPSKTGVKVGDTVRYKGKPYEVRRIFEETGRALIKDEKGGTTGVFLKEIDPAYKSAPKPQQVQVTPPVTEPTPVPPAPQPALSPPQVQPQESGRGLSSYPKIQDRGMSAVTKEKISSYLSLLPESLAVMAKTVPCFLYAKMPIGGRTGQAVGNYDPTNDVIRVGEKTMKGEKASDADGVFFHELGHAIGYRLGGPAQASVHSSFLREFESLSPKDKKSMQYYTGGSEPFAEVFAHIYSDKSSALPRAKFAASFPKTIQLMKEILPK